MNTDNNNQTEHTESSENPPAQSKSQAEEQLSDESETEDRGSTRWNDGDDITFVRVRFPGNSKSFPFLVGKRKFSYGQKVVAMSDRGMDVGYINSFPYTLKFKKTMLPVRSISKVASQEDIEAMQGNFKQQKEAEKAACRLIEDLGLDMQITHVEIIQFGKKMVFYFTAPARVDFRDLVKKLVSELKMRIELRQISVRDRAAALGSIGPCGLSTCCSSFLKNYGNVSIKMAKNQNLALIPSKINGVCGQIKCCIKYEDDVYSDKRKLLPKEGTFVKAANGDKGKVTKLHILVEQFDMITERGQIRRYAKNQYHEGQKLGKDYKFPDSFNHVVNETSNVIGLEESEASMARDFYKGMSEEEISQANLLALKEDANSDIFSETRGNISIGSTEGDDQPQQEDQKQKSDDASDQDDQKKNKGKKRRNRNRNRNRNQRRGKGNKNKGDS